MTRIVLSILLSLSLALALSLLRLAILAAHLGCLEAQSRAMDAERETRVEDQLEVWASSNQQYRYPRRIDP